MPRRSISPIRSNDDKQVDLFFNAVIESRPIIANKERPLFILVCHMAPTIFPFLKAINMMGDIAIIIPKGFTREGAKKIIGELQKKKENKEISYGELIYQVPQADEDADYIKKMINNDGINLISQWTNNRKFIIIDIGGYFSQTFEKIASQSDAKTNELRENLVGIVEDTENGHQKYANVLEKLKLQHSHLSTQLLNRLYSVARCALKNTEDYNVGKSIVEASGTILRVNSHAILERMQVAGVLGFGKIGRSIAEHLRQKNLREVIVYDINEVRKAEASSLGFKVVGRPELIMSSEMIFCATGSKCLKGEDLVWMKDNVFIASCTSAEDEFDFTFIRAIKRLHGAKSGDILKIKVEVKRGNISKSIHLLDDGNAVNFVHGAVNGPYIYSVQAALLVCAINLIESTQQATPEITLKSLESNEMESIAAQWLRFFDKCDSHIDIHSDTYLIDRRRDYLQNQNAYFNALKGYLEQNKYFANFSELRFIMDNTGNILNTSETSNYEEINKVLTSIEGFLEREQLTGMMGYISDLLLRILQKALNIHENVELIIIRLLFIRFHADLFISVNGKQHWPEATKDVLKHSFTELENKLAGFDNPLSSSQALPREQNIKTAISVFSSKPLELAGQPHLN